ncbi:SGNH/GDSL hydrolase family protein [Flavobacterium sp.]|uniref:SGNH/GDSL hydrolase family protein n=1 Tax=Flavobacterium sp. TaxID=239 RepID=UPI0040474024
MKNKFIYLAIIAAGFASCEPEFENTVDANYTSGDADFTSYVAVGNSLTAGYMDGTVYRVGQTYSFPNLLAQQFALVGGGEFTQPSYAEDVNNLGGIQGLTGTRLIVNASVGGVQPIAGTPTITLTPQAMAYNNMGVPGAKSFHLTFPGYGALNPYFARHATSPTATVLGDAMSKNPTFFTNWIGANDVLAYATNGGAQPDGVTPAADHNLIVNTDPTTYGVNDITNSNVFASVYNTIITTLTSNGAKGVVCTIPSVTSIPYFTTVKWNPLPAESTISAAPLYSFLSPLTAGRISPLSTTSGSTNPLLIVDEDLTDISSQLVAPFTTFITGYLMSLPDNQLTLTQAQAQAALMAPVAAQLYGKARQATSNDLVVLRASSVIGVEPNPTDPLANPFDVPGVTMPLANMYVLTANEKNKVANATAAYNAAIVSIANNNDLAVADMNSVMNQLVTGLRIETGQLYTANYFSGSATEGLVLFSLDGVHPNARGYAVIANEILKVINEFYNANLPLHNPSYFPGINIVTSN